MTIDFGQNAEKGGIAKSSISMECDEPLNITSNELNLHQDKI